MLVDHGRLPVLRMLTEGLLPSPLKVLLYRLRGGRIGKGVRIGPLSVVVAKQVEIGDGTRIGFGTLVRGRSVSLGRRVRLGALSVIEAEAIEIGADTRLNEQVYVAGPTLPESTLVVGERSLIQQHVFINPTKPVRIGSDTVIGAKSSIVTHATWPNALEGGAYRFAPVEIGDEVYVAWQVLVLPGVTIQDRATVGAAAVVHRDVDPNAVVAGIPARALPGRTSYPDSVAEPDRARVLHEIIAEFRRYIEYLDYQTAEQVAEARTEIRLARGGEDAGRIVLTVTWDGTDDPDPRTVYVCSDGIGAEARRAIEAAGAAWFDLRARERGPTDNPASRELADFISRYGVRLARD